VWAAVSMFRCSSIGSVESQVVIYCGKLLNEYDHFILFF